VEIGMKHMQLYSFWNGCGRIYYIQPLKNKIFKTGKNKINTFLWVFLTSSLRAHVKEPKSKKFALKKKIKLLKCRMHEFKVRYF
jgi:TM2 domain-containing membrane protein YozV